MGECRFLGYAFSLIMGEDNLESTDKDLESKVRKKFDQKSNDSTADWDSQELRCLEKLYDGNLNYADRLVGNLYGALKQLNILDNTVFIITSDHGEDLGMHGNGQSHGDFKGFALSLIIV